MAFVYWLEVPKDSSYVDTTTGYFVACNAQVVIYDDVTDDGTLGIAYQADVAVGCAYFEILDCVPLPVKNSIERGGAASQWRTNFISKVDVRLEEYSRLEVLAERDRGACSELCVFFRGSYPYHFS